MLNIEDIKTLTLGKDETLVVQLNLGIVPKAERKNRILCAIDFFANYFPEERTIVIGDDITLCKIKTSD